MREVTLLFSEQFGAKGPQFGHEGIAFDTFQPPDEDRTWYRVLFDGFEGFYLLPENMLKFND